MCSDLHDLAGVADKTNGSGGGAQAGRIRACVAQLHGSFQHQSTGIFADARLSVECQGNSGLGNVQLFGNIFCLNSGHDKNPPSDAAFIMHQIQ